MKNHHDSLAAAMFLGIAMGVASSAAVGAGNKACAMVTPAELEASLGRKVTLGAGSVMPGGVEVCSGSGSGLEVMIRVFKRTDDPSGEKEKAGIEALRKAGVKVEVQKFGPIGCAVMESTSATTSCSAAKPPLFAVIEVSGKEKIPMERLRPVAEKMMSRL